MPVRGQKFTVGGHAKACSAKNVSMKRDRKKFRMNTGQIMGQSVPPQIREKQQRSSYYNGIDSAQNTYVAVKETPVYPVHCTFA